MFAVLCEYQMKKTLTILIVIFIAGNAYAEDNFKLIGKYSNVKATETGHCYGEVIDIWAEGDNKLIGLIHIAQGLCGDPACSVITGSINDSQLFFNALVPVYNEEYSFSGTIINGLLTGNLNNKVTTLSIDSSSAYYKNKTEWCSAYSKVTRCKGVQNFCK